MRGVRVSHTKSHGLYKPVVETDSEGLKPTCELSLLPDSHKVPNLFVPWIGITDELNNQLGRLCRTLFFGLVCIVERPRDSDRWDIKGATVLEWVQLLRVHPDSLEGSEPSLSPHY